MGHSSRYKPGPTLDECQATGVTHIEVQCLRLECRHLGRLELAKLTGLPRNIPINHMQWRCPATIAATGKRCGNNNVRVAVVRPEQLVTPVPVFDLKPVKPLPRRRPCAGRAMTR